jgi:hypothetical protein
MSFHPLVQGTSTYNQTGNGKYTNATCVPGGPTDHWQIIGGKPTKQGTINSSVSRVLEKDTTVNGVTTRDKLVVNIQIQQGKTLTVADIDFLLGEVSDFLTVARITRLQLGES